MAYLESAVVVYLRELYYPDGFSFPLREIPMTILITEIGREAATIVMFRHLRAGQPEVIDARFLPILPSILVSGIFGIISG